MNCYPFPNTRIWRVAFCGVLLALLLLTRDAMYSMMILGFYKCQFLSLGILGLMGLVFLITNRNRLKEVLTDPRMVLLAISAGVILIPMLVKRDWQLMYFSILLCLFVGIFLTFFVSMREVSRYYVLIMSALSVYSLLTAYILRLPVDAGLIDVPVYVNGADNSFYFFGLSCVPLTYVTHRNFGIFREPGVYQFFLLLGLYLNNYHVEWKKSWQLWTVNGILAVTMLSTFATGGFIEMGLLAVVVFFEKKYYQDKRILWCAVAVVAAGILAAVYSLVTKTLLYGPLMDMLGKLFTKHESTVDRVGSILVNLRLFFRNPVFGAGLSETLHAIDNNTSSTTILFAVLGVVGGCFHVLGWAALVWEKGKKLWAAVFLLVILMMSFNTCNIITNLYLWIFPVMALAEKGLPVLPLGKRMNNGAHSGE